MSTKYEVGQEVRIFDVNGKRMGQPDGGWIGHVTKIGRTLFTVEIDDAKGWQKPTQYRIETGAKNDDYGHEYVLTLDEVDQRYRNRAARDTLHKHGIEIRMGNHPKIELLEALAAAAEAFTEGEEQ